MIDGRQKQDGFVLLAVLMLLSLLMTLLIGYFSLTRVELSTTESTMDSFVGFYAAEAGLNVRADVVRQTFNGYALPAGTSPDLGSSTPPCEGSNNGTSDFACVSYDFHDRSVTTFLVEEPNSPGPMVIARGELFQNLNGREHHYRVFSQATNTDGMDEASLEVHFKSRLVPLFQFAAFYDKDLEILPLQAMTLAGPVHTNGDLYVGTNTNLTITGQMSSAGALYRGPKVADVCLTGPVLVNDPATPTEIPTCSGSRREIVAGDVDSWEGMVRPGASTVTSAGTSVIEPGAGNLMWDRADLRVVLDLNFSPPVIEVRNLNGSVNGGKTVHIAGCGSATHSNTLYDNREGKLIDTLDVDVRSLLDCLHVTNVMDVDIDDTSDGGIVLYLGVDGPTAAAISGYGLRLTNATELASTILTAPAINGLTIATNQAVYFENHYNAVNKKPAAVLADSVNVLSGSWLDANSGSPLASRAATSTTINTALFGGTDVTGGAEGTAGQDSGGYNGGLENFMRLHEDWTGDTLLYRGSFVSLSAPQHVNGAWAYGGSRYLAPTMDFGYDTDFEDALLLPPASPEFVYLKQELFVRRFEL